MPSRETFAYRRALKLRAQKAVDDTDSAIDTIFTRAQDDFLTFCTLMDKAPAHHMLEWHKHLITGISNRYLLDIAGPNLDILAPRGSAKSTVLNMFTAWIIGRHTSKGCLSNHLLLIQHRYSYSEKSDYQTNHRLELF